MNIDLHKDIYIQVDGEDEKKHVLRWDILKKIGDSTQELIKTIAKFSLSAESIPDDLLVLEFTGFYPGSAVPAFKLREQNNDLFGITSKGFTQLNAEFDTIITSIDSGNFQAIADKYETPEVKNKVIDAVSNFTNAAGTKPMRIVKRTPANVLKFEPIATIRKMKPEVKNKLIVPLLETIELPSQIVSTEAVAKVIVSQTPKGRTRKKVNSYYTQKEATPALQFDSIEVPGKIYVLNNPVVFCITHDDGKSVVIENSMLDIYAAGKDIEEAKNDMAEQFDFTYTRLNELNNSQLSNHLIQAKNFINLLVNSVKTT